MAASDGIELDLTQFDKATRRMIKAGANLKPVFQRKRKEFRADQKDHFKQQRASDGSTWPKNSEATREKRLSRGGRAAKFTKKGRLRKPVARRLNKVLSARLISGTKFKATKREMVLRSLRHALGWATVHQHGGVVGRGSRLPQREFLWVSDPFLRKFVEAAQLHLRGAWEKKRL